jgi:hypothetical protein
MKKLNICIDIDGTITDAYYWLEPCNRYFKKKITTDDIIEYDIHKVLNIEKHEYEAFYATNKFKLHANPPLRQGAKESINRLNEFHHIHFVTAREQELEAISYMYLKRHSILYDSLHVIGSPDKAYHAKLLNCDLFIEDSLSNAIQLADAGFDVLLIDTNYNRNVPTYKNGSITRVFDWKEIRQLIQHYAANDQAIS